MEEGHRQFLPIAPLEMVHAVEAGATAPFDLQEEVGSLAHSHLVLSAKFVLWNEADKSLQGLQEFGNQINNVIGKRIEKHKRIQA